MQAVAPPRPPRLRTALGLAALVWVSFAWFAHVEGGWNVNSRLALTYAIIEQGTFSIDRYHHSRMMPYLRTNDKAFFEGRFYSDKSPALSFAGAAVYWPLWQLKMRTGLFARAPQEVWVFWTRYVVRVATVGVGAAALAWALLTLACALGMGERLGAALAFATLWGTVLAGYATLFFPYLPAAACAMWGWTLLVRRRSADGTSGWGTLFAAGLLCGAACFFEYTAGLALLGVGGYALWTSRRRVRRIAAFVAGAAIPFVVLCAYTFAIFGELSIPYRYEYDAFFREQMARGFQGIYWPRLSVLYYVTVHPYQGLFFTSPFLILAVVGAWTAWRSEAARPRRAETLTALGVVAAYLVFNSGYFMWWGGQASGPRHLCLAAPFFAVPIAVWLGETRCVRRAGVFLALAAVSVALNFPMAAVQPQAPRLYAQEYLMRPPAIRDNLSSPILANVYRPALRGEFAPNVGGWLFHLPRAASPLPLLALWGFGGWALTRRREDEAPRLTPEAARGRS